MFESNVSTGTASINSNNHDSGRELRANQFSLIEPKKFHQQLILWQLTDSALPTGGFVASSGLESSHQLGYTTHDESSILTTIKSILHSYAFTTLPYLVQTFRAVELYLTQPHTGNFGDDGLTLVLDKIESLDNMYNVACLNQVTKRASKAQGTALLMLLDRSFLNTFEDNVQGRKTKALIKKYKLKVRNNSNSKAQGHMPICLAVCLASLGVDLESSMNLHLYQQLRSLLSAAVRLNLVGPYQCQTLTTNLYPYLLYLLKLTDWKVYNPKYAAQTCPLLDILQTRHDALYSKIFNS